MDDSRIYRLPGGSGSGFLWHCLASAMAADDAEYREFCRQLEALGVDRKAIANGMGQSRSWVTRWMNATRKRKINADEVKRFGHYLDRFAALIGKRPDSQASGTQSAHVEVSPHAQTGTNLEQSRVSAAAALLEHGERVRSSLTKDHEDALVAVLDDTRPAATGRKARRRKAPQKGHKSPSGRRKAR